MLSLSRMPMKRKNSFGTKILIGLALIGLLAVWAVIIVSSLVVPALAVWALLHFAFHVV